MKDIVLQALQKERKRVERLAANASRALEAYMDAPREIIQVNKEAIELFNADLSLPVLNRKLAELKKREAKAKKAGTGDLLKLSDREIKYTLQLQDIDLEIANRKFANRHRP